MAKTSAHARQGSLQGGLTKLVFHKWETELKRWYGHGLPDDYLAWDSETTGFNKQWDLPVEFGWCVVRNRQPVNRGSFLLDWTRYPDLVEKNWLLDQLERIKYSMELNKRSWDITWERLHTEGRDPLKVIKFAHKLFATNREAEAPFVGHNTLTFDNNLWRNLFYEWIGEEWNWRKNELFDTGCLEKAVLTQALEPKKRLIPTPGEHLYDFLMRCQRANRPGIKWNMDACVARYQLCERFGVCQEDLHGASADAYCCHLLLELHREELENDALDRPG
jgi:DNA polymerase III epsilon subunit-like protein